MSFRESVSAESDHMVMSKSPNKHNRLYFKARPMEEGLPEAIDEGLVGPRDDPKVRGEDSRLGSRCCGATALLRGCFCVRAFFRC